MAIMYKTNAANLLTPKQAAAYLAISLRKLWDMTASGELSRVRIGRCVRYRRDTLDAFSERAEQTGVNHAK